MELCESERMDVRVDENELTEHAIREIVESSFRDCLMYPKLLLHEKMTALRNYVAEKKNGIIDMNLPYTDIIKIPLNCYSGPNLKDNESPFSSAWCTVLERDLDSYGHINFKWEPHEKYLLIIQEFIELCGQPDISNNVAIDFVNDFMQKLQTGVQEVTYVDLSDDEISISTGDMTTLYSSNSSIKSVHSQLESEKSDFTTEEREPPVFVRYADLITLKKDFDAYVSASKQKNIGSDGDSIRSSSEEKSVAEEQNSERRIIDTNGEILDTSSMTKRKKIITAETSVVPRYCIKCCKRTFSSYLGLFSHLRLVHQVGVKTNLKRKCKLCQTFVNEDLMMLHIELVHTVSSPPVEVYRVNVGFMDCAGETHKYVEIFPTKTKH